MSPRLGVKYVEPTGMLNVAGVLALTCDCTGGGGVSGFTIDEDGHLIFVTSGADATISIDDDGHLILEV